MVVKETELKEMYYIITKKSQNDTFTEINAKRMIIIDIKDEIKKLKQVIDKS